MNFNNTINHLKLWCDNKAEAYHKVYATHGGFTYVGYLIAYELEFKLLTLIDRPFENTEEFKRAVLSLIDVHYEPSALKPKNSLVKHIIDRINKEFGEFLEEVLSGQEILSLVEIPYMRVIVGAEAKALQEKYRSVWGYVNTSYWFPLTRDEPQEISEKFFIMYDYVEPYMKQVEEIIGLPYTHIYRSGEDRFRPPNCLETAEIIEYCGCEMMYTDKDFTWAIYFSHENTVAFAGSIVPIIKEMLSNESEHWNKFEWNWG